MSWAWSRCSWASCRRPSGRYCARCSSRRTMPGSESILAGFTASSAAAAKPKEPADARRLDPANATVISTWAFLKEHGRLAEAAGQLSGSFALEPDDARGAMQLARLQLGVFGLRAEARFAKPSACGRTCRRTQRSCHGSARNGRLRDAEESCREAIRIAPAFLRAWSNYVMCGSTTRRPRMQDCLPVRAGGRSALQVAASKFATGRRRRQRSRPSSTSVSYPATCTTIRWVFSCCPCCANSS